MGSNSIKDCALNISSTKDVTVSLICNGNEIKDYVLNNITGAESQCDLINKNTLTFLPYYVKTFKTNAKIYKHINRIDVFTLNNEPINVFVNKDEQLVDTYLWNLQDSTSRDDTFSRHYGIVTL